MAKVESSILRDVIILSVVIISDDFMNLTGRYIFHNGSFEFVKTDMSDQRSVLTPLYNKQGAFCVDATYKSALFLISQRIS